MRNELRLLVTEDLAALSELESSCFNSPWSNNQLSAYLAAERHFSVGLWQDNQLNGFALLSTVLDEAELLQIAVRPGFRGAGLAGDMLTFTHEQLQRRGIVRNMLEVRQSNVAALNLYRRFGYHQDAIRKGYYPTETGREDAVLLSCSNLQETVAG